ncbi:MAG: PilZ domain-containing protein [Gammaproteobacteria bacterium]|nr:PilZ domain-containing protein [Gammaproteobacteria bacterium]MBQ0838476.1 PilZ domain-containing protein [Gammaproteobacteria bacterium]
MKQLNPREACLKDFEPQAAKLEKLRQRPPRTAYTALAKVYDIVNKTTIGYIGDVSTSGFMLFSGLALPINQRRLVSVDLPHPKQGQTTIELGLRVVWSKPEKRNQQLQAIGCEIMAIEPHAKLSLLRSSMAYSHKT